MKYSKEIIINLPRERVIELFDDTDNMHLWQPGLIKYEHLIGEKGQPGAKARLTYFMNGREIEMIETVTHRNLPDEIFATYEAKSVYNLAKYYFIKEGYNKTKWVIDTEFKLGLLMSIIAFFMNKAFQRQTYDLMVKFKEYAEHKGQS